MTRCASRLVMIAVAKYAIDSSPGCMNAAAGVSSTSIQNACSSRMAIDAIAA